MERLPDVDPVDISRWGKDHWTTLMYVETRIVDYRGRLDDRHMRGGNTCEMVGGGTGRRPKAYPTILRGGESVANHDDFDCLNDFITTGLVVEGGTGLNPVYSFTDEGWRVSGLLRKWRGQGNKTAEFPWPM